MRLPFSVEVAGPFEAGRVRAVWTGVGPRSVPEVEALVAETWAARLAEATARGRMLWAGPMARLVGLSVEGDALEIRLGPTDYRAFVGTNVANPWVAEAYGPDTLSDGCGVSALVRTADGMLVLQRRSAAVFEYPGLVAACGGALEPLTDDPATPPEAQARRELSEELGLGPADVLATTLLGVGRSGPGRKPEIVYLADVAPAWPDLAGRAHEEHAELVALPDTPDAVAAALRDAWAAYAPPGLLALTLREVCRLSAALAQTWEPPP